MFGIGGFELFLIILFGFLIFGPDKLPEIAKTVGMAINKFKKAKEEMDGVIKEEIFDPTAEEPFKNPVRAAERAKKVAREKLKRDDHEETFAERKARYDRERAEAKKRAQLDQEEQNRINENRAKMKEEAAKKVQAASQEASQETKQQVSQETSVSQSHQNTQEHPKPKDAPRKLSAAEIYGTVPLNESFVRERKDPPASAGKSPQGGER